MFSNCSLQISVLGIHWIRSRQDWGPTGSDPGKTVVRYNFWKRAASKKCFLSPSCQSAGMDVSLTTLGTKSCNRVWFQTENLFYTQHVSSSSEHHKFHVTFGRNRDTKSKPRKTGNYANQPAWFCPQLMIMQTLYAQSKQAKSMTLETSGFSGVGECKIWFWEIRC